MPKPHIFFIVLTSIFLNNTFCIAQTKYKIKSCKIEYTFSTGMAKGTKTIIFDNYGNIEKQIEKLDSDSMTKQITIYRPDSIFTIYPNTMTGTARATFNMDMDTTLINNQIKKVGEGVFLGKKCEITDFHGFKVWNWNGIVLKKETPFSDKVYEYATAIDENYKITIDEFSVPIDIKFE